MVIWWCFCFSPLAYHQFYSVPIYNHILNDKDRLSEVQSILKLHLKTITLGDIEVCVSLYVHYCVVILILSLQDVMSQFDYVITRPGMMHGFASWFDVEFADIPDHQTPPVKLSTSPNHP